MDAMQTRGEQLVRGVVNRYEEGHDESQYIEEYLAFQGMEEGPLALSPHEIALLQEVVVQVNARVGTNMVVRPCRCRAVCGGIVECQQCSQEAM